MTIKDVARRARVSPGTVSNVLNRPDRVATATRVRVLAAIEATGYVRNAAASRLRSLDNRAIGILVIDVGNFFHAEFAKGAQHVAEELGFLSVLCDGDREVARTIRLVDFLESQRVAGVLATGSSLEGVRERLDALRARGVAMVLVDTHASDPNQCSVAVDDVRGGELVGAHLLSLGRRRVTFVQTDLGFRPFDDRRMGLIRAVGAVATAPVRLPSANYEDGRAAVDALRSLGSDAVFCANDHIAFGVLRELLARGFRVPEDVAVVGYDDTEFSSLAAVPLTSVRQPARLVGATATRLLLEECAGGPHDHQHIMFQPELVVRASTAGSG